MDIVKRTTVVTTTNYEVLLSQDEAQFLYNLLGNCHHPVNPRSYFYRVYEKLKDSFWEAGLRYERSLDVQFQGNIDFKE